MFSFYGAAVTRAPQILRACLNFTDSIVTISWKPLTDNCGSFSKYTIYGKKSNDVFQILDEIPQLLITEYPHKITDISDQWEYFLAVDFLCDGISTSHSDTISIDLTYPNTIQIDSVSYDNATQKILAGWQRNPSIDTRNYEIYDYTSGDGDSIGSTTNTNFVISDARIGRFPVVISTLDSCNLSSLLSAPHTPTFLTATVDTCLRKINLSWARYVGWTAIDSQSIHISINGNPYFCDTTLSGGHSSHQFSRFHLGDTISFFIRSHTRSGTVTSSSNIRTIETRQLVAPQYLYLSLATVNDEINSTKATPAVEWVTDNVIDIFSFSLQEGLQPTTLAETIRVPSQNTALNYGSTITTSDGKKASYFYRVSAVDKCGDTLKHSNISNTILLTITDKMVHNEYTSWEMGVNQYHVEKHDGSTWNTQTSQDAPFRTTSFEDSSGCYRIRATENLNNFGTYSESYSNIICLAKPLDYEITTGINTNTNNNSFKIIGTGINHTLSTYSIYNRWGQKIIQQSTDKPWYTDYNGQQVPPGLYIYIVQIVGTLGQTQTEKGTINVLR